MSTNEIKEKRGLDGTLWDDPDHGDGLPWRKNLGFLYSLHQEYGDEWVGERMALSEAGGEVPEVRRCYRLWLLACKGALTTLANGPHLPGDDYLASVLERPGMYAGPSVQTLELIVLNLLNFRAVVFGMDCDPREILRKTYLERFGGSCGAGGAAPKLIEKYGDNPQQDEIKAFYKAVVEAVLY